MNIIDVPTYYYEQFDTDYTLDVPAEGYGGWKKTLLPLNLGKTALALFTAGCINCNTGRVLY